MDKKRVLIVDDEPDVIASVRFRLELEAIACIEAHDGKEALSKAKEEKPDIILLDANLPVIDGYKVSRLLRLDKAYKKTSIIMLTARAQSHDVVLGGEVGADEYVTKPFDMEELLILIKQYLNGKQRLKECKG